VAVLPLENLSSDASQDYFVGMTDELITHLGQISALRVISRTSVMTYKNVRKPLAEIARELNVEAVVEGSVLRSGERVRITAQLIRVPADEHMWAQSYEGDLRDTLALQSKVAQDIAERIQATLNRQEQAALEKSKAVNPVAYEAYLKRPVLLEQANRRWSEESHRVFQQCDRDGSRLRRGVLWLGRRLRIVRRLEIWGAFSAGCFPESQGGCEQGIGIRG
jgi:TolB-like protein